MPTFLARYPTCNTCTRFNAPRGLAPGQRRTLFVRDEVVSVREHQAVATFTLTTPDVAELLPGTAQFPAVLDTGFSGAFCLTEAQFRLWADLSPSSAQRFRLGFVLEREEHGAKIGYHRYRLNGWIHPNRTGTWDATGRLPAEPVYLDHVMVCTPGSAFYRRVPYFGLQAVNTRRLRLLFDGETQTVTVRRRRSFLGLRF